MLINLTTITTSLTLAMLTAAIGAGYKAVRHIIGRLEASNEASKYLLKDRITQKCLHHQREGYLMPNDAEVLNDMAQQYWALGGNSYIKGQVQTTMSLPMEPKEVS